MPPIFSAAIGFSPAPAAVAHATALIPLLETALPLHFGTFINPLDALITRFFIACVRALVLCTACHASSSEFDSTELTAALTAAAAAGDAIAVASSDPASACVSMLHSAGLFSFLGALQFLHHVFVLALTSGSVANIVFCSGGHWFHHKKDT